MCGCKFDFLICCCDYGCLVKIMVDESVRIIMKVNNYVNVGVIIG